MTTGQSEHVDPDQAVAIAGAGGKAAGDAAEQGQGSAEAAEATRAAMAAEAERQGVKISEEDIKRIAEGTISQLEARGAFEGAAGPGPAAPPEGSAPTAEGTVTANAAGDGSGTSSTEPPAPPSNVETAPKRRTFAERFQGKG